MERSSRWRPWLSALLVVPQVFTALAAQAAPLTWTTSGGGAVLAIARTEKTVFIGGAFNALARPTGQGVLVDCTTGQVQPRCPEVAGTVMAAVPDGRGGWFVGGSFAYAGGVERQHLAHIRRDGSVDPWNPAPNGVVRTLLISGGQLYVGGEFEEIVGVPRGRAACFQLARVWRALSLPERTHAPVQFDTLGLTPWDPRADAAVSAIAVRGRSVFLGGEFTSIGGAPRLRLAEVDVATARSTDWAPNPNHYVLALALRRDVLYAGGYFGVVAGEGRSCLAAFGLPSGELLPLSLSIKAIPYIQFSKGPYVAVLLPHADRLYVGGYFTHVDGTPHPGLFAINADTSKVLDWDPGLQGIELGGSCLTLGVQGSRLYIGGKFIVFIGGARQVHLAALDITTGDLQNWDPHPDGAVQAIAISSQTMFVGGWFNTTGPVFERRGLAAIDAHTGEILPWDPNPDGFVWALKVSGDVVYVAGDFSSVGGAARGALAALDASTGVATNWNPTVQHPFLAAPVRALAVAPGKVFVGGWFGGAGGAARSSLACIDSASGLATSWDPSPDDMIEDLAVRGDTLYVGGWFDQIAGQSQRYLAAFEIQTGAALPALPTPNRPVTRLTLASNIMLVAGFFDSIGSVSHNGLVALDLTGAILPWELKSDAAPGRIHALAVNYPIAYFGGEFSSFGGLERRNLAAIDLRSGATLPWSPDADGPVLSAQVLDDDVLLGGTFGRVGATPSYGFCAVEGAPMPAVALTLARDTRRTPDRPLLLAVGPNPIRGESFVRFSTLDAGPVSARVYDLQGRCIATLLDDPAGPIGSRELRLPSTRWPAGCYLLRIESGRSTTTQKLLVVH